ncbi:secondary thiamine-phosphate synthase enzyme YjbQ [Candidatus Riflebacteria bacterium]
MDQTQHESIINSNGRTDFIDISGIITKFLSSLGNPQTGLLNIFIPHTTAGVTINENADPDVRRDMEIGLDRISPELPDFRHGEKNSFAHIKSTLVGPSLILPIKNGLPWLGTWQGIYFCEFDGPRQRKVRLTFISGN